MLTVFVALTAFIFILVLIFGYYRYDRAAIVLFVTQAVVAFVFWDLFLYGALVLAFTIAIHHYMIHCQDDFSDQITFLTLQLKDISNHETWIVASLTAALVYALCS